jgi:hypothetical protein
MYIRILSVIGKFPANNSPQLVHHKAVHRKLFTVKMVNCLR